MDFEDVDFEADFETTKDDLSELVSNLECEEFHAAMRLLQGAVLDNRTILAFGNGGSASNASHFVSDLIQFGLGKSRPVRCISPGQNIELSTAISNDINFDAVLKKMVENYLCKNDLLVVFSVSGTSRNIELGVRQAISQGAQIIGLFGKTEGSTAELADCAIIVPSLSPRLVETVHCFLGQELAARAYGQIVQQ